jgi:acetate kinase
MRHEWLTPDQMDSLMNKKSGLLGISWISPDMRDIIAWVERHDLQCEITMDMYINSIVKYIGAYTALMWGVDAIVLTAWVMERSTFVRARLMQKLWGLGITFDLAANDFSSGEHIISAPDSQVHVVVIPTNEELMIAKETFKLIKHQQ